MYVHNHKWNNTVAFGDQATLEIFVGLTNSRNHVYIPDTKAFLLLYTSSSMTSYPCWQSPMVTEDLNC